jgi:deoxyribodipyrimidine photo-lyase
MYWGKRLLAWRKNPAEAFDLLVGLNDRYSLDGRDPNGYAGIAWCFGRHDRPWPSQRCFGTVRAMVASGLARKFDMDSYTSSIAALYSARDSDIGKEESCSKP